MQEELITYHTAILAKELGFKAEINHYDPFFYVTKTVKSEKINEGDLKQVILDETCCDTEYINPKYRLYAGTKYQLQKWLRETHKIDIYIVGYGFGYYPKLDNVSPGNRYGFGHYPKSSNILSSYEYMTKYIDRRWNTQNENNLYFETYEEALEKGLQKALKCIKDNNY